MNECNHQQKSREYFRDMCEHDFPILAQKYQKLLEFVKYLAHEYRHSELGNEAEELIKKIGELNE